MLIQLRACVLIRTRAIETNLTCQFFAYEPLAEVLPVSRPILEQLFVTRRLDAYHRLWRGPYIAGLEHFDESVFIGIDIHEQDVSRRFEKIVELRICHMRDGERSFHLRQTVHIRLHDFA